LRVAGSGCLASIAALSGFQHATRMGYRKMDEYKERQYDIDEVTRIIRRALKIKNEDRISHRDLMETAEQIGLDPQIV
jgi:hypothetical protein